MGDTRYSATQLSLQTLLYSAQTTASSIFNRFEYQGERLPRKSLPLKPQDESLDKKECKVTCHIAMIKKAAFPSKGVHFEKNAVANCII